MVNDYPMHRPVSSTFAGKGVSGSGATFPIGFSGAEGQPRYHTDFYVLTKNRTVNNTTVLQDISELTFQLDPGTTYEIESMLRYTSGTTPDFRWDISFDIGAGLQQPMYWFYPDATTGAASVGYNTGGLTLAVGAGAGVSHQLVITKGMLVNAGSYVITGTMGFAQETADASDTVLLPGSFIRITRLGPIAS